MKRSFLLILFFTFSICFLSAQDYFYSIVEGETQSFTCYDASDHPEAYYSLKNAKIDGVPGDCEALYHYTFLDKNRKPLFGDDGFMPMRIVLTPKETSSFMYEISKATTIQNLITLGDVSSLPVSMKVGSDIPVGVINVKIKNINATFTISNRKVIANENVTTPAGTFNCFKLEEKQTTKVLISSVDYFFTSWYAKGVGCVKQMIYDKKGNLVRWIELTDIE